MGSSRLRRGGFTLLELMTVIAIIGILAAVAIPAFVKYIRKSKTVEATLNLATIATLQQAYKLDHGHYLACPLNPEVAPCASKNAPKGSWQRRPAWEQLGFRLDVPVYYQYEVRVNEERDAFTVEARGDLDCDDVPSSYRMLGVKGPIVTNEIE